MVAFSLKATEISHKGLGRPAREPHSPFTMGISVAIALNTGGIFIESGIGDFGRNPNIPFPKKITFALGLGSGASLRGDGLGGFDGNPPIPFVTMI